MKKKTKVIIITIISIVLLVAVAIFVGINIAGNYMVNTIVESVDEKTIDDLQKAVSEINTKNISVPNEEGVQQPSNTQEENAVPVQPTEKKIEEPKQKDIDYTDKVEAVALVTRKFSFSEINNYKNRYYTEGMTAKLVADLKADLKARCTPEEIEQIRQWYHKYK